MEFILDQLSPDTIILIEQAYGSLVLWVEAAASWTNEQLATIITEDIVW